MSTSNGSLIWIVGPNGLILRSPDGGNSFQMRSIGTVNNNTVKSTSLYIWIGGDNGSLVMSTNAGINFIQSNIGSSENVNSLYYINNILWAACSNGKLFLSTDNGSNWVPRTSPTSENLNCIKFLDVNTGVACGNNRSLILTTDGGNNWSLSSVPFTKNLYCVDLSGQTILACGTDDKILKSTDLGSSWNLIDYKIFTKADVTGLCMISATNYFSCGASGFVRKSTDGGSTFTYQNNPAWVDLKSIYFYDSLRGWAISGNTNMIIRTTDGGANWSMPNGTTQNLTWVLKIPLVYYTSSGNVFCQSSWNKKEIFVTKSNTLFRSLDVGETWAQFGSVLPYGSISNAFLISPKDTNIFLVAIDSSDNIHGKVLRSSDYGQSWSATFSWNRSSDGTPMTMDPNHSDTVYYGPTDSTLFRSTNFGLTWNSVGTRHFDNVCVIKVMEGNSNLIFVGGAGEGTSHLARSSDFGQNWTVVDSNTGVYPEVPQFVSSTLDPVIYCAQYEGEQGGLKRSFNNGLSWTYVNIDEYIWGMDVAKDDPNVIVYADWGGGIGNSGFISFDKGIHFSLLPQITGFGNFAVYCYNRSTIFLQQPYGFYKLKAEISVPIGIQPISNKIPVNFSLAQNYPNPFNPLTVIKFDISKSTLVKLSVFDLTGREITVLVNEELSPGTYSVTWNAEEYSSGVYFYRIFSDQYSESKKMLLIK